MTAQELFDYLVRERHAVHIPDGGMVAVGTDPQNPHLFRAIIAQGGEQHQRTAFPCAEEAAMYVIRRLVRDGARLDAKTPVEALVDVTWNPDSIVAVADDGVPVLGYKNRTEEIGPGFALCPDPECEGEVNFTDHYDEDPEVTCDHYYTYEDDGMGERTVTFVIPLE